MGRVGLASVVLIWATVGAFVVLAANEKGKPGGDPTKVAEAKPPQTQHIKEMMEIIDYVRSGAMIVGWLAINIAGRDTWMLGKFITLLAFGVATFFFPDAILSYETAGKLDAMHLIFTQSFGAFLIGMGITVYLSRPSRDPSVGGSILMSYVLGGVVMLQAYFVDTMKSKGDKQRWTDKHLTFGALNVGLLVLGSLYQYLRAPSYGSSGIDLKARLTKHLLIELLLTMPAGLFFFAFPDAVLSICSMKGFVPDGIHAHLVRIHGAVFFITALQCHSAMGFSDDVDKRAYIIGRLVIAVLVVPTTCLYQYKYMMFTTFLFYSITGVNLLITGNLLCAYFIRRKSKMT